MANRGKAAGKKAVSDGKPSDSRAGKRRGRSKGPLPGGLPNTAGKISAWVPGFLNWDII